MNKRINEGLANHKNFAAVHQIRNMPKSSPESVQKLLSQRLLGIETLLSSQPHCPSELDRSQECLVRFMQHQQEPDQLGQQLNQIILNSVEEQTLLHQIAQVLGKAFQVDCSLVVVTAENSSTAQLGHWHSHNNSAMLPQQQMLIHPVQLASIMSADSEPLIIDDVEAVETSSSKEWRHLLPLPVRAVLQIPTRSQGKINGMIILIRSQPYQWSELEKERALATVDSVAIAISQVVQTKVIASLQQQLQTSSQYQRLINQLMIASRASLELNQIFELAIIGTAQSLQVDRGLILTLKHTDPLFKTRSKAKIPKAKATVVYEWYHSQDPDLLENSSADTLHEQPSSLLNQSFWLSESWLCQQAFINSPNPLVITGQNDLPVTNSATDIAPLLDIDRLPALLILPLESGSTVLGFLVLQHSCTRLWHSEEIAFLEMVSALVSTAIIQSRTLRQVQSLVEDRTAQVQRSLEVQGKLYDKTRQQIDQLRQLNQLKDEFLSTMSHELRTPLTSMSLAIRMLRQPGITAERQAKYLDILQQQCNQEINLVNDLLKLQELESDQTTLNLETIDLKSKIHALAQSFESKWEAKRLSITLDLPEASLLFKTDSESIERILQELLTNAGKYSEPDSIIVLKATHQVEQVNQVILSVTNLGSRGISPEDVDYIFDKFRRGQGVTQQAIQGTGLGLALVKSLVQHLNGTVAVSSTSADPTCWETCFTLTLPQFD